MAFALLCLFFSAIWHTMSGCADPTSMEFCARIDYVGIGWYVPSPLFRNTKCSCHPIRRLISASIGTIVFYGFQHCYPRVGHAFLCLCFLTGLAGNIFPFMAWFNQHKYRVSVSLCISPTHGLKRLSWQMYRIAFFVSMAFSGIGPMVAFAMLHSRKEMFDFVGASYNYLFKIWMTTHSPFVQPQSSHLSYHT